MKASKHLLVEILYDLHNRNAELQERNDNQAGALEAAGDQLRQSFAERESAIQRNLEYIDDRDAAKAEARRLSGEIESLQNALDARGKTLSALQAEVEQLRLDAEAQRVADALAAQPRELQPGDKVRTVRGTAGLHGNVVAQGATGTVFQSVRTYPDRVCVDLDDDFKRFLPIADLELVA